MQFKKGPLDLSQFAVGIPIEKSVTIKNVLKTPTVYYLTAMPGDNCNPVGGVLVRLVPWM